MIDNLSISATSLYNQSIENIVGVKVQVETIITADISIINFPLEVRQGGEVTAKLDINYTGNQIGDFKLLLNTHEIDTWNIESNFWTINLTPYSHFIQNISFNAPDSIFTGRYNVPINLSYFNNEIATNLIPISVLQDYQLSYININPWIEEPYLYLNPGETKSLSFTITNEGNGLDSITISEENPYSDFNYWNCLITPSTLELNPGQTSWYNITISSPNNLTIPDIEYLITISGEEGTSLNYTIEAIALRAEINIDSIILIGEPREMDDIRISIIFNNTGNKHSTPFTINVYYDDDMVFSKIIPSIRDNNSVKVNVKWNIGLLEFGSHEIKVVADSKGQILELNEDNNQYSINVKVRMYTQPYIGTILLIAVIILALIAISIKTTSILRETEKELNLVSSLPIDTDPINNKITYAKECKSKMRFMRSMMLAKSAQQVIIKEKGNYDQANTEIDEIQELINQLKGLNLDTSIIEENIQIIINKMRGKGDVDE